MVARASAQLQFAAQAVTARGWLVTKTAEAATNVATTAASASKFICPSPRAVIDPPIAMQPSSWFPAEVGGVAGDNAASRSRHMGAALGFRRLNEFGLKKGELVKTRFARLPIRPDRRDHRPCPF